MSRRSLLICLLAISCSDYNVNSKNSPGNGDGPDLRVKWADEDGYPSALRFGGLGQDDEPVTKQFEIESTGASPLEIDSLVIQSDVASFTLLTEDLAGMTLLPNESTTVDVMFEPMADDEQWGQAVITSNVDFPPTTAVELVGSGTVPELEIYPNPLDMGTTYVGCVAPDEVRLKNVGTELLQIYEVDQEGESFRMTSDLDLPIMLETGESVTVQLEFEPSDVGELEGALVVQSNEPLGTREGIHLGEGDYSASYEDEWIVPEEPPSDIIFYVDQSGSMSDDKTRLASNFSTFISELATYSTDWQIIVATADNGCNSHGGVLRPEMPDYETRFQSAVEDGGGFLSLNTEKGLTITSEAVEKTDAGECNWGFLRPEAMLHIIMVSDEPEQSSSSWGWYMDKIVAKKGSSANVKFSAIAGDYPGGCATAEAGDGYYQPVMATDGVYLSICSDWATPSNLAQLAAASVQMAAFELSATPAPSTIRVWVNGTERLTGWRFDADDNTVIFDDGIPEDDDVVRVTYGGVTICD
jgi:hypothetical protein